MDTNLCGKFNADDLVEKGLVTKKTYNKGLYKGLSVYKYTRKVFFDNLWGEDSRLLDCRGIVIDTDYNIISYPFTKIFNYLENDTQVLPETFVTCPQKMNGFLGVASNYKGQLLVSTTGTLDSAYADLAKTVILKDCPNFLPEEGWTLMFEICDPSDPHIIKEHAGAYLIGIRRNKVGSELLSEAGLDIIARHYNFHRPLILNSLFSHVLYESKSVLHEGFMVRDFSTGKTLCKLKSRFYLQKKALQRIGKSKADIMFNSPSQFKQNLDEEFYALFDYIIDSFTKEEYLAFTEQERSELIFNYFEGNTK